MCVSFSSRLMSFCYFLWPNFIGWAWAFFFLSFFLAFFYGLFVPSCVWHGAALWNSTMLCAACVHHFCFNTFRWVFMHSFHQIRWFDSFLCPSSNCPPLGMIFVILIIISSWSCNFLSPLSIHKTNIPLNKICDNNFVAATAIVGNVDEYVFFIVTFGLITVFF